MKRKLNQLLILIISLAFLPMAHASHTVGEAAPPSEAKADDREEGKQQVPFNPAWYKCADKRPDGTQLQAREVIKDRKIILGRGAFGVVFECEFDEDNSEGLREPPHPYPRVIVKKVPSSYVYNEWGHRTGEVRIEKPSTLPESQRNIYEKEYTVTKRAAGDHVVTFFHFDPESGVIYGERLHETLHDYLRRCLNVTTAAKLSVLEINYMETSLREGLSSIHETEHVHGDLSLGNIMLVYENPGDLRACVPLIPDKVTYKIIDLGAATRAAGSPHKEGACAEGRVPNHVTTPFFESHYTHQPQFYIDSAGEDRKEHRLSYLGDMYSLGMVLASMIHRGYVHDLLSRKQINLHRTVVSSDIFKRHIEIPVRDGLDLGHLARIYNLNRRLLLYLQADIPRRALGETESRLMNYKEFLKRLREPVDWP